MTEELFELNGKKVPLYVVLSWRQRNIDDINKILCEYDLAPCTESCIDKFKEDVLTLNYLLKRYDELHGIAGDF